MSVPVSNTALRHDEVERVVRQQAAQGVRAEAGHQLVRRRRFRSYRRQLAQGILHGGLPVPDGTGPLQGPQPGFAVRAGRAFFVGTGEEAVRIGAIGLPEIAHTRLLDLNVGLCLFHRPERFEQ